MAENNMPDKAEQPVLGTAQNAPTPPNLTAEEAEIPAYEGVAASALQKPAPSREPIPIFKENPIGERPGKARSGTARQAQV